MTSTPPPGGRAADQYPLQFLAAEPAAGGAPVSPMQRQRFGASGLAPGQSVFGPASPGSPTVAYGGSPRRRVGGGRSPRKHASPEVQLRNELLAAQADLNDARREVEHSASIVAAVIEERTEERTLVSRAQDDVLRLQTELALRDAELAAVRQPEPEAVQEDVAQLAEISTTLRRLSQEWERLRAMPSLAAQCEGSVARVVGAVFEMATMAIQVADAATASAASAQANRHSPSPAKPGAGPEPEPEPELELDGRAEWFPFAALCDADTTFGPLSPDTCKAGQLVRVVEPAKLRAACQGSLAFEWNVSEERWAGRTGRVVSVQADQLVGVDFAPEPEPEPEPPQLHQLPLPEPEPEPLPWSALAAEEAVAAEGLGWDKKSWDEAEISQAACRLLFQNLKAE